MSLASKVNIPVHTPGLHGAAKLVLITGCAQEEPQVEREGEETKQCHSSPTRHEDQFRRFVQPTLKTRSEGRRMMTDGFSTCFTV